MPLDRAQSDKVAAVTATEFDRTCSRKQLSTERSIGRAEFAAVVDRVTASHGGSAVIGRALQVSRERVDQLRDQDHAASLCFGDALAASRKGARGWARELAAEFKALVDNEEAPSLAPELIGMQLSALVGRFNEQLAEFLTDGALSPDERARAVHALRTLAARAETMAQTLEERPR